ncbi:hypothetical protein TVNIR_2326 [Thioalkalivibrio nitratireducens DSM 14787]|uniref:Uncharacterized protein n=1 Tax=Thioalkalivibrio nitratireducens (strain DSM 14787 / UNIQEM 213 / ALEN2) TaxID=1255043 RepID=L0DWJ9_THIND|nr:UPF0158 family protein [Thioalkalivibrio nitratireducens]AGA33969.1 hypothetical protein TVNIR_2326 [Thioalkalivibrio nitratireducens DSM 14787]
MALPVSIQEVVDAMQLPNDDWCSYLNVDTGEIVTVTDEDRRLVEDDVALDDVPVWQREVLPKAREALESDRFLPLPGPFDIHEWSIMEEFADGLSDEDSRAEVLDALRGRGAFRHFRSTIERLGIESDWYRYRDSAFERIAKEWLDANNVPYR